MPSERREPVQPSIAAATRALALLAQPGSDAHRVSGDSRRAMYRGGRGHPAVIEIISRILSAIMALVTAPLRALAALFGRRGRRT